jgi:hypothetical protein
MIQRFNNVAVDLPIPKIVTPPAAATVQERLQTFDQMAATDALPDALEARPMGSCTAKQN